MNSFNQWLAQFVRIVIVLLHIVFLVGGVLVANGYDAKLWGTIITCCSLVGGYLATQIPNPPSLGKAVKGALRLTVSKLTDFADFTDLVAWTDKASTFLSPIQIEACDYVGDNGRGASGKITATLDTPMCALPEVVIIARWGSLENGWGRPVQITYQGKTITAAVQDGSPVGDCDLNPAALAALGQKHPFSAMGSWQWAAG